MNKYILRDKRIPESYTMDDPSSVMDKLNLMESQGIDIDDLTVMVIDTEKYPPITQTAKEFLETNRTK